jgi:hypothetical protein
VVRGGYGIFYDQIFQNLTLFSLSQSGGSEIFATLLNLTNSAVGVGQLANYRYGVDPLPAAPAPSTQLPNGAFGRINDPNFEEAYVQKFSIGFQKALGRNWSVSSDYVHTLGIHEPRVQVINPRIENVCNPAYPGSTPSSPRCVRGVNSRYFDQAFVAAGMPANRLEQINMIGGTNRSLFDSWTTTFRGRMGRSTMSLSYVLGSSRAWGAQPTASYSGNGIATTPENQFREGEFGATRNDERHRIVVSAVLELPAGFQLAPILQFASSRPYSPTTGFDIDGDGLATNDRLCASADLDAVFAVRGNSTAIRALNPLGCQQATAGSQRGGFVVDANGSVSESSGRYFNIDLRVTKSFDIGQRVKFKIYADMYNLFNTENLAFSPRVANSNATSAGQFLQPVSLFGPGFGPPVGRPFTAVFGGRFEF